MSTRSSIDIFQTWATKVRTALLECTVCFIICTCTLTHDTDLRNSSICVWRSGSCWLCRGSLLGLYSLFVTVFLPGYIPLPVSSSLGNCSVTEMRFHYIALDIAVLEQVLLETCYSKMAVFWVVVRADDGGSKDLWNVGELLPYYTAIQPWRQPSSYSPPWELQILLVTHIIRSSRPTVLWRESYVFRDLGVILKFRISKNCLLSL
jgi:hypothetical protein